MFLWINFYCNLFISGPHFELMASARLTLDDTDENIHTHDLVINNLGNLVKNRLDVMTWTHAMFNYFENLNCFVTLQKTNITLCRSLDTFVADLQPSPIALRKKSASEMSIWTVEIAGHGCKVLLFRPGNLESLRMKNTIRFTVYP